MGCNLILFTQSAVPLSPQEIKAIFLTLPLAEQGAVLHIDKTDSQTSATLISVLEERIQFFKYIKDWEGDFSFKKYIRAESKDQDGNYLPQPNLYILNIEKYAEIFKPLMTLAIDSMSQELLSMPDKQDRRCFFIIDELGSLYRMRSILQLQTVGRSKGGSLICASQDLGRIEEAYGKANLQTLFNNFNINFTFRIREPQTANYLSNAIGEKQIIKQMTSRQMSPQDVGDRKSFSEQEKTERLVIPTEFQKLKNFEAIIDFANFGVAKTTIPKIFYSERNENFIMRQFDESVLTVTDQPAAVSIETPDEFMALIDEEVAAVSQSREESKPNEESNQPVEDKQDDGNIFNFLG